MFENYRPWAKVLLADPTISPSSHVKIDSVIAVFRDFGGELVHRHLISGLDDEQLAWILLAAA